LKDYLKTGIVGITISSIFVLSSCSTMTYTVHDYRIKVHRIKYGEKAPFDGYLLNDWTYKQIKKKLAECKKQEH